MTGVRDRAASLARLHALVGAITADLDLGRTLEAVCQGVVEGLGFGVAAINLLQADGAYDVVAVVGPPQARESLLGQRASAQDWDRTLAGCEPVGSLLVDYRRLPDDGALPTWVSDAPASTEPGDWHPLDMLLAPLSSPRGGLLGVLSVDLPGDGRRPGPHQLEVLELYAAQASVAIENAGLHTKLVARDAERAEVLSRLSALVAQAPVAIVELDPDGRVREWNPAAEQIFGWTREEVLGQANPAVAPEHDARRDPVLSAGEVRRQEVRRRRQDGTVVDVSMSASSVRALDGPVTGFVVVYADISARVALERDLRHAAHHDTLTGLPNRELFSQRLARQTAEGVPGGLLLVDLDGFKGVNDTQGHAAGDAVLIEVAARLRAATRTEDTVARLGGDEFVVLVRSGDDVVGLAARLLTLLREPLPGLERGSLLGASIGIAPLEPGADSDLVMRDADLAMYAAKAAGRGRYRMFDATLLDASGMRVAAARRLEVALDSGEVGLVWRPVVAVATGEVVGHEGVPVHDAVRGTALAELAETAGLLERYTAALLRACCRAAHPEVSVPLTAAQLGLPRLVELVRSARAAVEDPPGLTVHLRGAALAAPGTDEVLRQLHELGVGLTLADLGAGTLALGRLRTLPLVVARLDAALLEGVEDDPGALAVLEAGLGLVHGLGLASAVDGVTTDGQLQLLRRLGCGMAQGPLFPDVA